MSIFAFFLACSVWVAIVQSQFFFPDGTKEDFSESWTVGEVMTIMWSKGWYGIGEELSSADLWITWFDLDAYSQLLLQDVSFDMAGSLNWKINVSNSVVMEDQAFVLRFKLHSSPPLYTSASNQAASRGFRLFVGDIDVSSSSNSISSTTSVATLSTAFSSTSVILSTSSAGPTSTPGVTESVKSKKIGPIVGGSVGGLAILVMSGIIAILLLRLAKKKKHEGGAGGREFNEASPIQDLYVQKGELDAVETQGSGRLVELDGNGRLPELGDRVG